MFVMEHLRLDTDISKKVNQKYILFNLYKSRIYNTTLYLVAVGIIVLFYIITSELVKKVFYKRVKFQVMTTRALLQEFKIRLC
jgi:hypothetical protein